MSRQRGQSFGDSKIPHTVSLKVLRLTRPALSNSHAVPSIAAAGSLAIAPQASLAYPDADPENLFALSPVLTLPESFQSAYVGEIFSCTVCANNELSPDDTTRRIGGVKIQAEIQSPSTPSGLAVDFNDVDTNEGEVQHVSAAEPLRPGASLQKIMKINLREQGNHVLAITVTYTETQLDATGQGASGGRARTFRKLYQFVAQNLVGVRTKAGNIVRKDGKIRYAVEAQLENLGERVLSLEAITMTPRAPFDSRSLNWDKFGTGADPLHSPVLNPRDVYQVAYLLEQKGDDFSTHEDLGATDSKMVLGQLNIQWRSSMGDRGSLSTGWLVGRKP